MCADNGNNGDDLEKEKIVNGEEMRMRIGTEEFVCGDAMGEEDAASTTTEVWLTGGTDGTGDCDGRGGSDGNAVKGWGWSGRWLR